MQPFRPNEFTRARTRSLVLCAVLFLLGAAAAPAQSLKVGVVDINKVFGGYYKTRDGDQQVLAARQRARQELDERLAQRKQMLDDIKALSKAIEDAVLSPDAKSEQLQKREDKIRELRQFEQSLEKFQGDRQTELQELATRTRNQIVEEIMVVINAKVQRENYDLILNKSGQGLKELPFVLYGNDKLDMTAEVIAILNKDHPTPTPGPTASATPAGSPKK